mgnify:FL=1
MSTLRISGVQMRVASKMTDNLPRILDFITHSESDFILFPEMALTGHHGDFASSALEAAWDKIAAACRLAYATAIVGTGARDDGHGVIQSRVFSDEGEVIGTHEKLVPTKEEHKFCRPGTELRSFEHMGLSFGCLIGNDMWVRPGLGPYPDPRLSYQLGKKGVQVVFHSLSSGSEAQYSTFHEANLKLRAIESKAYIVTANAASPNGPLNAPSGVMSPEGEWLVKSPLQGEQTFSYDLEI